MSCRCSVALRVDRIRREDVLRILTPIWTKIPEVARKQRNRIQHRTVLVPGARVH